MTYFVRRISVLLVALTLSAACWGQSIPLSPNVGLQLPPHGTLGWDQYVIQDLDLIDSLMSGTGGAVMPHPAIKEYLLAGLAAVTPIQAGRLAIVRDCSDSTCATGSGTLHCLEEDTGSAWIVLGCTPGSGSGGLTSVGLSATSDPFYAVSNSPLTSNGTLALALKTQSANCLFAGPTSGSAAAPTCRAMVPADLPSRTIGIAFIIDGAGSTITTGTKGYVEVPFACTLTGWTLMADQAGSIVVDVKSAAYSAMPTTASVAGTDKPTLSTAQKAQNLTLSAWTTAVTAGTWLEFNVGSATTVQRVTVALRATIP